MYQSSHCPYEEERLVGSVFRGDVTAWKTMFDLYHPPLVSIIKILMHGESGVEQAEDIAAAVWSSLCSEAYIRLRRYDPKAGRLLTYLAAMARREIGEKSTRSGAAIRANPVWLARRPPGRRSVEGSPSTNSSPL